MAESEFILPLCRYFIHFAGALGAEKMFSSLIPPVKSQKDVRLGNPRIPGEQRFYVLRAGECGFARQQFSGWAFFIEGAEVEGDILAILSFR